MEKYNVEQMIDKKITYRGREYLITNYEIYNYGVESIYFVLKLIKGKSNDKVLIPLISFDRGDAITNDKELLDFVAKCNLDFHKREQEHLEQVKVKEEEEKLKLIDIAKQEEEKRQQLLLQESEEGTRKGKDDARNKISVLYKAFTSVSAKSMSKANEYSLEFRKAYIIAYEEEKKLMKQEKLVASRSANSTLDDYPGDVDKLIGWMRKNLLRIDVYASPDKIDNEQMAIDAINDRDGTNYQVKVRHGQYVAYEATFKNPKTAPKEFLSWMVSKHDYTTSDLKKRVMAHPMNVETGKMTCNSLVKELIYDGEYAFHVGKAI